MNKKIMFLTIVVVVLSTVLFSCASAPVGNDQMVEAIYQTVDVGYDESILVIQRRRTMVASAISMRIWMNGIELTSGIRNGQEIQIVIPNGEHNIQAGSTGRDRGNTITFFADNDLLLFYAEPAMGGLTARFNLTQLGRRNL